MNSRDDGTATARLFGLLRVGWGVVLVLTPRSVLLLVPGGHDTGQVERYVARALGGREILQGTVTALFPSRRTLRFGAAIDAVHVTSMVGLAVMAPESKSASLSSATVASCELMLGLRMGNQ